MNVLIASFIILVESTTDIYTPSLPIIKSFFHSSEAVIQWTISANLIGLSISSILYGPLSDYFGRRGIILVGNLIFFFSSILCCVAKSIVLLIIGRFFQGIGGGAALVVGYAIVKDIYDNKECSRVLSSMGMYIAIAPGIAPVIGGYIASFFQWYYVFYLIAAYAFILLVMNYFFLKESLISSLKNKKAGISFFKNSYINLLTNHKFMGFLLIQSFIFTRVFSESIVLPFVYVEGYGLSIEYYGLFMFIAIIAYVIGTVINRGLIFKLGIRKTLEFGVLLFFSIGLILSISTSIFRLSPLIIEMIKFPGAFSLAFIFSNATTLALDEAENFKGLASSLISIIQTIISVIFSFFLVKYCNNTYFPLSISYLVCGTVTVVIFLSLKKHKV